VQNKVLEAMAMSAPTISTPAGCEALDLTDGQEILLGGNATAFADAVMRVLSDPVLRARLSALGRRYVETHHSWQASVSQLIHVYQQSQAQAVGRVEHR
jgi:glycosyltransferase involved in cell wall biosynthesis